MALDEPLHRRVERAARSGDMALVRRIIATEDAALKNTAFEKPPPPIEPRRPVLPSLRHAIAGAIALTGYNMVASRRAERMVRAPRLARPLVATRVAAVGFGAPSPRPSSAAGPFAVGA